MITPGFKSNVLIGRDRRLRAVAGRALFFDWHLGCHAVA